jgi:hypothetical protein
VFCLLLKIANPYFIIGALSNIFVSHGHILLRAHKIHFFCIWMINVSGKLGPVRDS